VTVLIDFTAADVVRALIAIALALTFPFMLFYGVDSVLTQTYENAVTAVFGASFVFRDKDPPPTP
jgi:TRAP-type C4-dicarboxylate transport system permease large subunit